MRNQSKYPPLFPYLKHLQADFSFATITAPLSHKIGEAFCEGLKRVFKVFEIDKKIFKNLLLSLKVLLQSLDRETCINSAQIHFQKQEFGTYFIGVTTETNCQ